MTDTVATVTAEVDSAPAGNEAPAEQSESYESYRARISGQAAPEPVIEEKETTQPEVPAKPETPPARKPYQNAVPPERVEALVTARDRRIAELETELRLASEGRLQPAATPAQPEAPARLVEPDPQDFNSETGFDSKGYGKAVAAYARQEALEAVQQQQEATVQAQQHQEFVQQAENTRNEWLKEAQPLAEQYPEVAESLSFLGSDAVLRAVPREVTMELLQAHPLVGHMIASDQRLFDIYRSGDVLSATKLIARIDARVTHELAQRQTKTAAAAPEATDLRVPARTAAPAPAAAPTRPEPSGMSDVDAGPSSGANNSSYAKYRAERMKAAGRA